MQPMNHNTLFLKVIDALHEDISHLNALILQADISMSRMIDMCSNDVERKKMELCRHEYLLSATRSISRVGEEVHKQKADAGKTTREDQPPKKGIDLSSKRKKTNNDADNIFT